MDIGTLPDDGSPPQCFYNIACQDAELTRKYSAESNRSILTDSIVVESDDTTWTISWPIDFKEVMSFDD